MLKLLFLLLPISAQAYESECFIGNQRGDTVENMLCNRSAQMRCSAGIEAIRGTLYGEHTWITEQALARSGLGNFTKPYSVTYFTDGHQSTATIQGSQRMVDTENAVHPMQARRIVTRDIMLQELSQVPDVSYSFSDFLAGNEHCYPANTGLRRDDWQSVEECHDFAAFMGSVNSSHFGEQARLMYERYHNQARALARRCRRLSDAMTVPGAHVPAAEHEIRGSVLHCEWEALAFEAVAAHFLEDGWSTGHMWERWGSPIFGKTPNERGRAHMVGAISGLLHGARGVIESFFNPQGQLILGYVRVPGVSRSIIHDRLSLPGPFRPDGTFFPSDPQTRWIDPISGRAESGAGDDYLLSCRAIDGARFPQWGLSFSGTPPGPLDVQRNRMLNCVASGFLQVYEDGPTFMPAGSVSPDFQRVDPLGSSCWGQRATNESMALAWGLDSAPNITEIGLSNALVGLEEAARQKYPKMAAAIGAPFRTERVALRQELRTKRDYFANNSLPVNGTTSASLQHYSAENLYGSTRNNHPSTLNLYRNDRIEYLEHRDPDAWDVFPTQQGCRTDNDCPAASRCVRWPDGTRGKYCARQETAIPWTLLDAEMPAYCGWRNVTEKRRHDQGLDALRARCKRDGSQSTACEACIRTVSPQLRNACDQYSYDDRPTGTRRLDSSDATRYSRRSACDLASAAGVVQGTPHAVYSPYDPADQLGLLHAAQSYCEGEWHPEGTSAGPINYGFQEDSSATFEDDVERTGLVVGRTTCGAGVASHWWRFKHRSHARAHTHQFTLKTRALVDLGRTPPPIGDLEVRAFVGPDCVLPLQLSRRAIDPQTVELTWPIHSNQEERICLQVVPTHYDAWLSYDLTKEDPLLVDSVSPTQGLTTGGQTIIIEGERFRSGMTVLIGGRPASSVQVSADSRRMTVVTPGGTAGTVDIVVQSTLGNFTLPNSFTYIDYTAPLPQPPTPSAPTTPTPPATPPATPTAPAAPSTTPPAPAAIQPDAIIGLWIGPYILGITSDPNGYVASMVKSVNQTVTACGQIFNATVYQPGDPYFRFHNTGSGLYSGIIISFTYRCVTAPGGITPFGGPVNGWVTNGIQSSIQMSDADHFTIPGVGAFRRIDPMRDAGLVGCVPPLMACQCPGIHHVTCHSAGWSCR